MRAVRPIRLRLRCTEALARGGPLSNEISSVFGDRQLLNILGRARFREVRRHWISIAPPDRRDPLEDGRRTIGVRHRNRRLQELFRSFGRREHATETVKIHDGTAAASWLCRFRAGDDGAPG